MSFDNSHREFILSASTLIERMVNLMRSPANGCLPIDLVSQRHPMNLYLNEWSGRLVVLVSSFLPENGAQDELRTVNLRILNFLKEFVDEILAPRVVQLYESQCPNGMMLAFFIGSVMQTLDLIEYHLVVAISGMGCDRCDGDCLQNTKEEWSEARANRNSIKLYLLVMFLQRNESCLPRNLIVEMIDYAQHNYSSHCPLIYQEALHAMRLGKKVVFPITMHFIQR